MLLDTLNTNNGWFNSDKINILIQKLEIPKKEFVDLLLDILNANNGWFNSEKMTIQLTEPPKLDLDQLLNTNELNEELKTFSMNSLETNVLNEPLKMCSIKMSNKNDTISDNSPSITIVNRDCFLYISRILIELLETCGWKCNTINLNELSLYIDKYKQTKNHYFLIYGIYLIDETIKLPDNKYIIYQLEQNLDNKLNENYADIYKTGKLLECFKKSKLNLDYSFENIRILQNTLNVNPNYLPIPFKHTIINPIHSLAVKKYDLVFIGSINKRRQIILNKLNKKYSIFISKKPIYGNLLEYLYSVSKILINIHFFENSILESTRINEAIETGIMIISELPTYDLEIVKKYEKIVKFIEPLNVEKLRNNIHPNIIDYEFSVLFSTIDDTLENYNLKTVNQHIDNININAPILENAFQKIMLEMFDVSKFEFVSQNNTLSNFELHLKKYDTNYELFLMSNQTHYFDEIVASYKKQYSLQYSELNNVKNQYKFFCYYYLNYIQNLRIPPIYMNLENEAVLIEFRSFPHLAYTLRNAIMKLGNSWSYTIVCGIGNYNCVLEIVQQISFGIRIIKQNIENINESEYSKLLTQVDFWQQFRGSKLLIYQEDAAIFKTDICPFLQYDYIGAPWLKKQNDTPNLVGNGGFSLRSKRTMIDTICTISPENTIFNSSTLRYMTNTKSTIPPEDVYFSKNIQELGIGSVAEWSVASDFSTETVVNLNSFGGHNFWINDANWQGRLYNSIIIQFKHTFTKYFNRIEHRGGWKSILSSLIQSHFYNTSAPYVFFDTLDFYFLLRNDYVCTEKWCGIVHMTPYTPSHLKDLNIGLMFSNPLFIKSLSTCFLLITLSDYLAVFLREQLTLHGFNILVISMKHPIDEAGLEFSLEKYTNNKEVKLIQIGQQLRRITSIYRVKLLNHSKLWLTGFSNMKRCSNMLEDERMSEGIGSLDLNSVQMYYTKTFEEYDELLSQNVVFIDLYDAAANNVVLECIIRATPLIINKVGGVVEYLGEDYPLYFENLDDVPRLLSDYDLIVAAHYYLKALDKSDLTIDRFKQSLFTAIHQSLGTMGCS